MKDLFTKLLGYELRDIPFPCSSFEVDLSQDHVEHKWPDRDGAHVEGTGRNPLLFTARAMFRNGIKPGPGETFDPGALYPSIYRKFILACADRSSGIIQHPEFGQINVKCKSVKTHWDANKRDGVDVDVVWVESSDSDVKNILSHDSPTAQAVTAAAELDAAIADANETGLHGVGNFGNGITHAVVEPPPVSFTQMMNSITGIVDQVSLSQKQIAGKFNEISYQLDVLSTSVDSLRSPQTWPIRQSIERLRSSVHDAKTRIDVAVKPISLYVVPQDATLSAICAYLGASITDILSLNSTLYITPIIGRGTVLRYYTNLNDRSKR